MVAYAAFFVLVIATFATWRQKAPIGVVRWAGVAMGLVIGQIWVAAEMVLRFLPSDLRGLHLAVGVALWVALVVWATLAQRLVPAAETES